MFKCMIIFTYDLHLFINDFVTEKIDNKEKKLFIALAKFLPERLCCGYSWRRWWLELKARIVENVEKMKSTICFTINISRYIKENKEEKIHVKLF